MYRATEIGDKPVVVNDSGDVVCYCPSRADAKWRAARMTEAVKIMGFALPAGVLWELAAQAINRAQIVDGLPETMPHTAQDEHGEEYAVEIDMSGFVCQVRMTGPCVATVIESLARHLTDEIDKDTDFDIDEAFPAYQEQRQRDIEADRRIDEDKE